jgi:acyl-ACP thioesterase
MLNAADFHSRDRGFGMDYLNSINKTWVLSRLAIEMDEMPLQYEKFYVETWVESAMRYFTNRNFRVVAATDDTTPITHHPSPKVYGYGRSIWAMIDTETRQPCNLLEVNNGSILEYVEKEKENPMAKLSRVKMDENAELVRTIETNYCDVDINGHINSVKYIEHVLDLFSLEWYKEHMLKRFDIAYVAESHGGDKLSFYRETDEEDELAFKIRITKLPADGGEETEVCRSKVKFV